MVCMVDGVVNRRRGRANINLRGASTIRSEQQDEPLAFSRTGSSFNAIRLNAQDNIARKDMCVSIFILYLHII